MNIFLTIIEAIMLASSLSLDAFVASFAYGSNKIKIPFSSIQIMNLICSSVLGLSILIGSFLRQFLPEKFTIAICFILLFILGMTKLMDSITKSVIRRYNSINKEIKFSMFNFKFILSLYADPEAADVDSSKIISPKEAVSLAIALSLDGLAVGFGAALGNVNGLAVVLSSLVIDMIAIVLGCYIGNKVAKKISINLSWLSGLILIILAIMKLV